MNGTEKDLVEPACPMFYMDGTVEETPRKDTDVHHKLASTIFSGGPFMFWVLRKHVRVETIGRGNLAPDTKRALVTGVTPGRQV